MIHPILPYILRWNSEIIFKKLPKIRTIEQTERAKKRAKDLVKDFPRPSIKIYNQLFSFLFSQFSYSSIKYSNPYDVSIYVESKYKEIIFFLVKAIPETISCGKFSVKEKTTHDYIIISLLDDPRGKIIMRGSKDDCLGKIDEMLAEMNKDVNRKYKDSYVHASR